MMQRREFFKTMAAGAGISVIKPAELKAEDIVIFKIPGPISCQEAERIKAQWEKMFTGRAPKPMILADGIEISIIKKS